jgi:hypothetical protein
MGVMWESAFPGLLPQEASFGRRDTPLLVHPSPSRLPEQAAPPTQQRTAVFPGAPDATAQIMRLPAWRGGPAAAGLWLPAHTFRTFRRQLCFPGCQRAFVTRPAGGSLGSWPDAATISLTPRFLNHFPVLLFPFCSLSLEQVPPPPPPPCPYQLPRFSLWQTKLVSPLIIKADFLDAWRHSCSNTQQGGEWQSPSQLAAEVSRTRTPSYCVPCRWEALASPVEGGWPFSHRCSVEGC